MRKQESVKHMFVSPSITNSLQEVKNNPKENELVEQTSPSLHENNLATPTPSEESIKGNKIGATIAKGELFAMNYQYPLLMLF